MSDQKPIANGGLSGRHPKLNSDSSKQRSRTIAEEKPSRTDALEAEPLPQKAKTDDDIVTLLLLLLLTSKETRKEREKTTSSCFICNYLGTCSPWSGRTPNTQKELYC